MIFKNTLTPMIRVLPNKQKQNSVAYHKEAIQSINELGQIIERIGFSNIKPTIVSEAFFAHWLLYEAALANVSIERLKGCPLSSFMLVERVRELIFKEVVRLPDEKTVDERVLVKEKLEAFEKYIPEDVYRRFLFHGNSSSQEKLLHYNISAIAFNLLNRSSSLEHVPNALFGYWFRLESLLPLLSRTYGPKVWFYLPEIIQAVRKEIPSFFPEVTWKH